MFRAISPAASEIASARATIQAQGRQADGAAGALGSGGLAGKPSCCEVSARKCGLVEGHGAARAASFKAQALDNSACSLVALHVESEFWVWANPFLGKQQSELISDCGLWDETGRKTAATRQGIQKTGPAGSTGPSSEWGAAGEPSHGIPILQDCQAGQLTAKGSDHGMQGSQQAGTSKLGLGSECCSLGSPLHTGQAGIGGLRGSHSGPSATSPVSFGGAISSHSQPRPWSPAVW